MGTNYVTKPPIKKTLLIGLGKKWAQGWFKAIHPPPSSPYLLPTQLPPPCLPHLHIIVLTLARKERKDTKL
jgi:hypothetical protein